MFGEVVNSEMQLNEAGQAVYKVWAGLPRYYSGIELDAFVIMPNHVHGIIVIRSNVGAIHESPLQLKPTTTAPNVNRRRMLLSKVIGRFKMVTAKHINELRRSSGIAVWQRNYYEHIVRDDESLNRLRQYISITGYSGNLTGRTQKTLHPAVGRFMNRPYRGNQFHA
jgi:REP element-mobilizing transposase RayT